MLFKWLFSTTSKSKKYLPEILLIGYLLLTTLIAIVLCNFVDLLEVYKRIVSWFVLIQWLLFPIPCILRIIDISDYNEKQKISAGNKRFKYDPLLVPLTDIQKWVVESSIPDVLYLKGNKKNTVTIVEIGFETVGKNGPFINKKVYINDKEIVNFDNLENDLKISCLVENDCVYLLAIIEGNDPKLFNCNKTNTQ